MKLFNKTISGLILIGIGMFYGHCSTVQKSDSDGYIYVKNVVGYNKEDAELNAKRSILEIGLGEYVEGSSKTVDGQLKQSIINTSTEGFVTNYTQIGDSREKNGAVEIDAKGKVNKQAIEDALTGRYKDLGKPSFLMIVDEKILGRSNSDKSVTITENAISSRFKEFGFLDKNQLSTILNLNQTKTSGIYGNTRSEKKALTLAQEMEAQILLVGNTEVVSAGKVDDSDLVSYQAVLRFKIFDVNNARIIAADNSNGATVHINSETGSQIAIEKAVEKAHPKILDQISTKWKPGTLIRIDIEGLSYDEFLDSGIRSTIRNIRGVNGVYDKNSKNSNKMIVVEVEALFNGNTLYRKLRERKSEIGMEFKSKKVTAGSIHIIFQKRN